MQGFLAQYSFTTSIRPNGYLPFDLTSSKWLHPLSYGMVVNCKSCTFGNSNCLTT